MAITSRRNRSGMLHVIALVVATTCLVQTAKVEAKQDDSVLRKLLADHNVTPVDPGGGHSQARIELGRALFFDRELSGNRDTSCATCHHPTLGSGDGLALPVGTGPENPGALGPDRIKGDDREFVPRNAPEIFNRGSEQWTSMFWDSRIAEDSEGNFTSPAGANLLPGLTSSLYIQAMFPVTSRDEMRGFDGDMTFEGEVNEIGAVADGDLHGIWDALMNRLMVIPKYRKMFEDAYPDQTLDEMTFANAANAIGAFEIAGFTMLDTPFDQYLNGNDYAMTPIEKRGATLFFGEAKCANCHSGPLLTDQKHWGIAVPQLGPGKAEFAPRDLGRFLETEEFRDLFAFRTPPLRNVAKTGPYMHNGAYNDLRSVIEHHNRPVKNLFFYNPGRHLDQTELRSTTLQDIFTTFLLTLSLDRSNLPMGSLSRRDIRELTAFLNALTAPDFDKRMLALIPESVPSGLPIEGE